MLPPRAHVMLPSYLPPAISLSNHAIPQLLLSSKYSIGWASGRQQLFKYFHFHPSISNVQKPQSPSQSPPWDFEHGSKRSVGFPQLIHGTILDYSSLDRGFQFGSLKAGNKAPIPQRGFFWAEAVFQDCFKEPPLNTTTWSKFRIVSWDYQNAQHVNEARQPNPNVTTGSEAKGTSRSKSQTS